MGCCESYDKIYKICPDLVPYRHQFEHLGFNSKAIYNLHRIFNKINDGSRKKKKHATVIVDVVELLIYLDVKGSIFTSRIFNAFDKDKSGSIEFHEFVFAVWNYCTLPDLPSLTIFAFDLYDSDSDGYLQINDAKQMLHDIYGKQLSPTVKYAFQELKDLEKQERLSLSQFQAYVQFHNSLLFPAFLMQRTLRKKMLGISSWNKMVRRRMQLSEGKFVAMEKLLAKKKHKKEEKRTSDTTTRPSHEARRSRSAEEEEPTIELSTYSIDLIVGPSSHDQHVKLNRFRNEYDVKVDDDDDDTEDIRRAD